MDDHFVILYSRIGTLVAPFCALVALISIAVAGGNQQLSEIMAAFLGCMAFLCPLCTVAGCLGPFRGMRKAAYGRVAASVLSLIVVIIFMIIDLSDTACREVVGNFIACNTDGTQRTVPVVAVYVFVCMLFTGDIYASWRVIVLIKSGKFKQVVRGETQTNFVIDDDGLEEVSIH